MLFANVVLCSPISSQGNYQSTLDGVVQSGSAHGLLFSATDLTNAPHQLVLQNAPEASPATALDIDSMVITTGDGNDE